PGQPWVSVTAVPAPAAFGAVAEGFRQPDDHLGRVPLSCNDSVFRETASPFAASITASPRH
ncbi:MAG: hypothetical protein OXC93_12030, partial [Rhodospirillaceae bacterium]|nr:hypothetical protein [Rhodospirillaceae bacterium]